MASSSWKKLLGPREELALQLGIPLGPNASMNPAPSRMVPISGPTPPRPFSSLEEPGTGPKGTQRKIEQETEQKAVTTDVSDKYITPEQYAENFALATGEGLEPKLRERHPYQIQERGAEALEAALAEERTRPYGLDLSPLLALTKSETGADFLSSYKPPESADERRKRLLGFQEDIQKRRGELTKAMLEGFKSQRAGKTTEILSDLFAGRMSKGFNLSGGAGSGKDPKEIDTQKLAKQLQDSEAAISSLASIKDVIKKTTGKDIEKWAGEEIPGAGMSNILGKMGTGLLSDQGAAVTQAVNKFALDYVYMVSGKQTNEAEARRMAGVIGNQLLSGDRDLVNGIKHMEKQMDDIRSQRKAGFSPEVIKLYESRRKGPAAEPKLLFDMGKPGQKKKDRSKMSLQELEAEAKARGVQ
jgi:hypothetical protein